MSISGRIKAMLYTLALGIAGNAGWYAIQRSWSHLGFDLYTVVRLAYFVFIAALGVFIGIRISKKELTNLKQRRLEELRSEANFLWNNRGEQNSFLWQEHRKQWVIYAISAVANYLDISKKDAERRLCDCPAMKAFEEADYLECHMKNVKAILDSSS